MPVTPTYPGVYIEEIPSGVRTITGVATSITAFIGRAKRGPVNEAVLINGYADFERLFGGLWVDSAMSYAVRDFYLNGGSQAIIVRLYHPYFADEAARKRALKAAEAVVEAVEKKTKVDEMVSAAQSKAQEYKTKKQEYDAANTVAIAVKNAAEDAAATSDSVKKAAADALVKAIPMIWARLKVDTLELEATSEGAWGNALKVRVDHDVSEDAARRYGLKQGDLFNLSVRDGSTGQVEVFRNVSVNPKSRPVDKVLENESSLVRVSGPLPNTRPEETGAKLRREVQEGEQPNAKEGQKKKAEKAREELSKPPFTSEGRWILPSGEGSDGQYLTEDDLKGSEADKQGLYALEKTDLFNLLCIPPYENGNGGVDAGVLTAAAAYCEKRRALLLVDSPSGWKDKETAKKKNGLRTTSKNAAVFFPRLRQPNPLKDNQVEDFAPCGAVAGVFARTDAQRGVWKAPAGLDATLVGVPQLSVPLTDAENGELNPLGINCLRTMPAVGPVVWGARTLQGDDRLASEWKYIPVRRLALYIEESLYRGTQWVVFEPNDEPLWAQIRLNVGAFMHNLFRQGAFQGKTPREAYFVKCDRETTTQDDINRGIVNIVVGFAPLKPAEFVIIKIQQMAGQIAT